jgi:ATP synthase, H+ transporting, mitochondrial F0 complex, subunit s
LKIVKIFTSRLLRNGSCVKFLNAKEKLCDYNLLPPENTKFFVQEILAEDAGISHIGFPHIKGCAKLDKIVLSNCGYIEDEALKWLVERKDSLKHLEIVSCKNITEEGLRSLKSLNLEKLILKNLPYVKDVDGVAIELKSAMPNCQIEIEK